MSKKQSRNEARAEAFKLIFQKDMHKEDIDSLFSYLLQEKPESSRNMDYIRKVVNGVTEHEHEIEEIIGRNLSKGWKLGRISKVSLCILKLAVYEMKYVDDVPPSVAINEAVELVKIYDEPDKAAFVNGVLGGVYKEISEKKE
ncbi:MAG: transcription antitermination factor NusB [Clostridia bacterium]|nr:transcription antitermination factor NusB [Clostridia bacterium]